jgi:hypothetical protein
MTLAKLLGGSEVRLPEGSRRGLLLGTSLSALAFGWSALTLPWRPGAPLALLAWCLGSLHVCTAFTLLCWPDRVGRPLRLLSLGSWVAAPVFLFAVSSTSLEMVRMYGPLGWALTVALGAIGWLLLLGTVPVALFGWYVTRSTDGRR